MWIQTEDDDTDNEDAKKLYERTLNPVSRNIKRHKV